METHSSGTGRPPSPSIAADAYTWLYVLCVVGVGAVVVLRAATAVLASSFNGYVLLLAAITIVAGRFSIQIPGRPATVSFSELFVFTSVVLFGAAPATLTVAIDGLWVSLRQRDRRTHRALFNVAEPAISTWAAGHAFFFVVAETSTLGSAPDLQGRLAGTLAMAATCTSFSTACSPPPRSRSRAGDLVRELWRHQAIYLALNVYAAASLAALLVRSGSGVDLQAIGLVAPLLFLSYAAYKTAATRLDEAEHHMREVEHLYAATIETLAIAVDAKDQVTHGHIRRRTAPYGDIGGSSGGDRCDRVESPGRGRAAARRRQARGSRLRPQ